MTERRTRAPRLAPELRRREIMDATVRLAASVGFGDLTVDAIAAEAGITRPVVYDLFGDLSGVLAAVVEEAAQQARAAFERAVPSSELNGEPEQVVHHALLTMLSSVRTDPALWRLILWPPDGAPPQIRSEVERNRRELVARITPLATEGLATLGIEGADPAVLARLLMATAEEMGRLVLEHPRRYAPERVATTISGLVRAVPAAHTQATK